MKVSQDRPPTVVEIRAEAQDWYAHQIEIIQQYMGAKWEEHADWVKDYLKEELRQRLIARGWRPRDVE